MALIGGVWSGGLRNNMSVPPSEWLLAGGRVLPNMSSGDTDGFQETVAQEPLDPGGIYLA